LTLESRERIPGVCERSLLRCIESRGLREPSFNCLVRLLRLGPRAPIQSGFIGQLLSFELQSTVENLNTLR